ncbi:MAG TPA: hypothetical protein VFP80_03565, partial [Thermoanaerobaculia bacterium]|nr:hypothetical protein [Thermoanaerobaculia bacterium]
NLLTLTAPEVTVLVGGEARREYVHRGTTYIEALRGREFTIRLRNPTAQRVAVALSVDGLNTIDAKHSDAWGASKWVLEPYETTEISGWQVSDRAARRFFFTGERSSYGAKLGQTENLGIIEAVFYRERVPRFSELQKGGSRDQRGVEGGAVPPAAASQERADDEYAATGMGRRTRNEVEEVAIDLERSPIASVALRYEFRPQLVKLGVFEREPLERRERAKGFCPEK